MRPQLVWRLNPTRWSSTRSIGVENRVLEIRLEQPLSPFREVTVQLLGGITASDGVELPPWSLSFFAGP